MMYALVENKKSKAMPKLEGICQYCQNSVHSKCGPKNIWHWAHISLSNCDPWWEEETEWHRKWKSYFQIENQEIIHFDSLTSEKHIADVKTNNGKIIEFQNSPISNSELESREKFYKNMFWIINGKNFINNFKILDSIPNPVDPDMQKIVLAKPCNGRCYQGYSLIADNEKSDGMVKIYPADEFRRKAIETKSDFYFFEWKQPRKVWYDSTKPVFIDFGGTDLYLLKKYSRQKLVCVRKISKKTLIEKNGGEYTECSN